MEEQDLKAKILYYCRKQMYCNMLHAAEEAKNKFRSTISFQLYHALALILSNRIEEAINELGFLKSEYDIRLAITVALMYAHKFFGSKDKELFVKLDTQMRDLRKSATHIDYYNTGFILFSLRKFEKARDYVERSLMLDSSFQESICLKGWIELNLPKSGNEISQIFESILKDNKRNLDASLGLAESYLIEKNHEEAIATLNKAIVRFPTSDLPLIEKMEVLFAMQDWEQCNETIARIFAASSNNLEAMKINILLLLCRDANYEEASTAINKFIQQLEKEEPKNDTILFENSQLFSRLCARNHFVLSETFTMIERALEIVPNNTSFLTELGYQNLLKGTLKDALKYYKLATKVDDSSVNALMGMTLCELTENGISEQIKQQVEFLMELTSSPSTLLLFMKAKLENTHDSLNILKQLVEAHFSACKSQHFGPEYLRRLDPDFLLDVVKEYFQYVPQTSEFSLVNSNNPVVATIENLLTIITKACPGFQEALYLLAKVQYLNGASLDAIGSLQHILSNIDPSSSDAYLLMAQIQINMGQFERAAQNLEVSLSHNFKVRENPLYHLIDGLVKKRNDLDAAIKCFTASLSLIKPHSYKNFQIGLTLADKASIYVELITAHTKANQTHEAAKLISDAAEEFRGTSEESRIMILNADYAIKTFNVQEAIDMLSKVKPNEPYYLQTKQKLANIFLDQRRDKGAYLQCYKEMVENNTSPESFILLGDAYMHILDPDRALEAYEKALKMNPNDSFLISKMGTALVKTHYYDKAVSYYKDSIKLTDDLKLKLQLADLHILLKQFDEAEMLLVSEIDCEKNKSLVDIISLQLRTKLLNLLSQTREKAGNINGALQTLQECKENQDRVRKRLSLEQTMIPLEEIVLSVDINLKLADIYSLLKNNDRAIDSYKDALFISPNNTEILANLAKLYMHMNQLELCQQTCTSVLNLDSQNEAAVVLMADIAFRKVDFDMASFHFTQLLTQQPTNWTALARLIEVSRRIGNLEEVSQHLKNAEQFCESKNTGFSYCTALYQWYSGDINGALRNFNLARQDSKWGQQALVNMIEICLNPEDEILSDQFVDSDDTEYRDSRSMALKTAERLLKELKQQIEGTGMDFLKYRLLGNFLLLSTKEKLNIERALDDFVSLASQDIYKEHVGLTLGIASAHTLLKQSQRAKNQLKRVTRAVWTFEDAEYLERCWLLLADYYIQSTKYDLASDLLKRVLEHDKSCMKAYEYSGLIAEKEQSYKEAANYLDSAWKFGGKSNPSVGYKLAFNLMKCKRYADAIETCNHVLKIHPDYPKIKKDILDKSINNLRT